MGKKKGGELGRALMNDKSKARTHQRLQTFSVDPTAELQASSKLRSVTEQTALEEFLTDAVLRDADFSATKGATFIVTPELAHTPFVVAPANPNVSGNWVKPEASISAAQIPKRPAWDATTTPEQLDMQEREAFLEWRRSLASLEDEQHLLLTPFEKNLEVWRQLWRVVERSDVIVQIVDARNPLLFRSQDLEEYVRESDNAKECILLINKADLLSPELRDAWSKYFESLGVRHLFFSARTEQELIDSAPATNDKADAKEGDKDVAAADNKDDKVDDKVDDNDDASDADDDDDASDDDKSNDDDKTDDKHKDAEPTNTQLDDGEKTILPKKTSDGHVEVLDREGLMAMLEKFKTKDKEQLMVGMVGFPNVGKSSTINVLLKAKKVAVSATPGKTKHFQTLKLTDSIILCDCPGLVFPRLASSKAEMVLDGVLPIDQLRDHIPAAQLLCDRIPRHAIEDLYGVVLPRPTSDQPQDRPLQASEVLSAYASMRGFITARSLPDEARAARILLKDYVNGLLLYCHFPPTHDRHGIALESSRGAARLSQPEIKIKRVPKKLVNQGISYDDDDIFQSQMQIVQPRIKSGGKKKRNPKHNSSKDLTNIQGEGGVLRQPVRQHLPMKVETLRQAVKQANLNAANASANASANANTAKP
eukprot:c5362_g1_i1.p1 GENE.c5362_g1_i1~~c5362_g1_i1.p1  ORF type:complete len:650 (-),score=169.79 c5362_g1_i1:293-2242(-)